MKINIVTGSIVGEHALSLEVENHAERFQLEEILRQCKSLGVAFYPVRERNVKAELIAAEIHVKKI